jgi:hypothetical protein
MRAVGDGISFSRTQKRDEIMRGDYLQFLPALLTRIPFMVYLQLSSHKLSLVLRVAAHIKSFLRRNKTLFPDR